jgi:hypothetical protein
MGVLKKYLPIPSQCNAMKKYYVISRIEASQDGAPYVYIALSDPNDFTPGSEKQQNPFGPNMMAFTSPEDMMKRGRIKRITEEW